MGFQVGSWLHEAPRTEHDADGRRAVVQHICFGPLETRVWYECADGRYCREIHFLEGLQAGERFTDFLSGLEMRKVLDSEIALCEQCGESGLAAAFRAEQEGIESRGV
ncbi:MAG: hypothetical protein HFF84_01020 [Oscillibacter sp.]|nr:hypothetical protein [Oscillibacter sp.]